MREQTAKLTTGGLIFVVPCGVDKTSLPEFFSTGICSYHSLLLFCDCKDKQDGVIFKLKLCDLDNNQWLNIKNQKHDNTTFLIRGLYK